jgi:hypothetical protein
LVSRHPGELPKRSRADLGSSGSRLAILKNRFGSAGRVGLSKLLRDEFGKSRLCQINCKLLWGIGEDGKQTIISWEKES